MEEFKIQTSMYSPEFGRSPGGQVSIATRSGTNGFHGNLFDYFRNEALDANNWFNDASNPRIPKPPERQNDFGGTLAGPILKDRTFFFASYEGLRLQLPQSTSFFVPSVRVRKESAPIFQPVLNSFPIPTSPEPVDPNTGLPTGSVLVQLSTSVPQSLDAASIRIDHRISGRVSVFGRFVDSRSQADELTGANWVTSSRNDLKSVTAGANLELWPTVLNEVCFNYSSNQADAAAKINYLARATRFDTS